MSEQQAKYHLENETVNQAQAQPIEITLNAEQVRDIIHSAEQRSPGLIIAEALKVLAHDTDIIAPVLLSESDAKVILKAIITHYPNLAQKVIADIEESVNS